MKLTPIEAPSGEEVAGVIECSERQGYRGYKSDLEGEFLFPMCFRLGEQGEQGSASICLALF